MNVTCRYSQLVRRLNEHDTKLTTKKNKIELKTARTRTSLTYNIDMSKYVFTLMQTPIVIMVKKTMQNPFFHWINPRAASVLFISFLVRIAVLISYLYENCQLEYFKSFRKPL